MAANTLRSQIATLEQQLQDLRQEMERIAQDGKFLLEHLSEPKSFAALQTITGAIDGELIHQLYQLEKVGKIERCDLPRWVRTDLPENAKGRFWLKETPLRQHDLELLNARRKGRGHDPKLDRPYASDRMTALKDEGLVRLGEKKGDPWYLPESPGPGHGGQSPPRRSRRGRTAGSRPKRRPRGPQGGT